MPARFFFFTAAINLNHFASVFTIEYRFQLLLQRLGVRGVAGNDQHKGLNDTGVSFSWA